MKQFDVIVIGGGPAGLAAAIAAAKEGAKVLLIEREERLGGILKQCIHDGFGLLHFGEKLSGPEYAERFEEEFHELGIACRTQTFVTEIRKKRSGTEKNEKDEKNDGQTFVVTAVGRDGVTDYEAGALILATGCRERTAKQVSIHGTRPAGVFTAGTAQHFVNLLGEMPTKRCVILGSGDIGLIMARRLMLEGAKVLGVYEVKPEPSGLTRNIMQCLEDYDIPLHLSHTVTRVFGQERLEAVEIAQVDEGMRPIPGTEQCLACDALILSVGLIPENEIAESLGVTLDTHTKGPVCDDHLMTDVEGVFSCGNALHVNDLVDYVSESGLLAGQAAAAYSLKKRRERPAYVSLDIDGSLQYLVPQRIELSKNAGAEREEMTFYFRSRRSMDAATLCVEVDGETVFKKRFTNVKPPEMERFTLKKEMLSLNGSEKVRVYLTESEGIRAEERSSVDGAAAGISRDSGEKEGGEGA